MQLRSEVFPAPFGPITACRLPRRTSKLTSLSAVTPRKCRIRFFTFSSGMLLPVGAPRRWGPPGTVLDLRKRPSGSRRSALTGRPELGAPPEEVQVHVEDELPAVLVHVYHGPPARAGHAALSCNLRGHALHLPQERVVGGGQVVQGGDVPARHHQHVHRGLRVDVVEGDDVLVFVDQFRRDLPPDDPAEEAVRHSSAPPAASRPGAAAPGGGQDSANAVSYASRGGGSPAPRSRAPPPWRRGTRRWPPEGPAPAGAPPPSRRARSPPRERRRPRSWGGSPCGRRRGA